MNKWPKHIEECLAASIEHGPDTRFEAPEAGSFGDISYVLVLPQYLWKYLPPHKPDIEQWGNEYADGNMFWRSSLAIACNSYANHRIAIHHRIVDGETGMTKLFETLEVFK